MPISFNVPSVPSALYTTTIDNAPYIFRFKWQERNSSWYMDIETQDGTILTKGSKLVPRTPLIKQNLDKGPDGNLYIITLQEDTSLVPSRYNIGPDKEFELVYYTNEELSNGD